jgi:hypothetical protein
MVVDLRDWIGQRKDDRVGSHALQHVRREGIAYRKPEEDISAFQGFAEGVHMLISGKLSFQLG